MIVNVGAAGEWLMLIIRFQTKNQPKQTCSFDSAPTKKKDDVDGFHKVSKPLVIKTGI